MANDVPTISSKGTLKVMPEFDGFNITLIQFFEECSLAKDMVWINAKPHTVKLIK